MSSACAVDRAAGNETSDATSGRAKQAVPDDARARDRTGNAANDGTRGSTRIAADLMTIVGAAIIMMAMPARGFGRNGNGRGGHRGERDRGRNLRKAGHWIIPHNMFRSVNGLSPMLFPSASG